MKPVTRASLLLFVPALISFGAQPYQKPPQAILDVLNAPPIPALSLNPSRTYGMEGQAVRNPPIAELAQPMLRLAGVRINPKTNGLHNEVFNTSLTLRKIPEGTTIKVDLPPNPKLSLGRWSPDGSRFAFTNTTPNAVELWIGETATGKTHQIPGVKLNGVMGGGFGGGGGGAF